MDQPLAIALFGESERGEFTKGYQIESLEEMQDILGNPPPESRGIFFAIQALLHYRSLIFFRVKEEGFSLPDYKQGLAILERSPLIKNISAICTPGVGSAEIIDAIIPICHIHHHIFITNESDFYDYMSLSH